MIGPEYHGGGHPWHGLCQDGTLALPNDTFISYPQPAGGDCFKLAVPGYTASARSTAQLADDTGRGFEWLDHALVSGDSRAAGGLQVYGKPFGKMRWIWAVSKSEKWLVDASALSITGGVLSGTIDLTEFGMGRATGEAATAALTVSVAVDTPSMVDMRVLDLSTSGNKALIGLYAYADVAPVRRFPVAVVQVTLAVSAGVKSVSVVGVYGVANIEATLSPLPANTLYGKMSMVGAVIDGATNRQFKVAAASGDDTTGSRYTKIAYLMRDNTILAQFKVIADLVLTQLTFQPALQVSYIPPPNDIVRFNVQFTSVQEVFTTDIVTEANNQDFATAAKAEIDAGYSPSDFTFEDANVAGLFHTYTSCQLLNPPINNDGGNQFFRYDSKWIETVVEQLTFDPGGPNEAVWKRSYTQVKAQKDAFTVGLLGGKQGSYTNNGDDAIVVLAQSPFCNYLKKEVQGDGATNFFLWVNSTLNGSTPSNANATFTCECYKTLNDVSISGTPFYANYNFALTYSLVVDGVTTALGSESFTAASFNGMDYGLRADLINRTQKGNADRMEFYWTLSGASPSAPSGSDPYTNRRPAFAEALVLYPCAGVFGLTFTRILEPGATPHLLYKLADREGLVTSWLGWSAISPLSFGITRHPVTGQIQAIANKSVCFV